MSRGTGRAVTLQLDGREVATLRATSDNFPWVLGTLEFCGTELEPYFGPDEYSSGKRLLNVRRLEAEGRRVHIQQGDQQPLHLHALAVGSNNRAEWRFGCEPLSAWDRPVDADWLRGASVALRSARGDALDAEACAVLATFPLRSVSPRSLRSHVGAWLRRADSAPGAERRLAYDYMADSEDPLSLGSLRARLDSELASGDRETVHALLRSMVALRDPDALDVVPLAALGLADGSQVLELARIIQRRLQRAPYPRQDRFVRVSIDSGGRLALQPARARFPFVHRVTQALEWDTDSRRLVTGFDPGRPEQAFDVVAWVVRALGWRIDVDWRTRWDTALRPHRPSLRRILREYW